MKHKRRDLRPADPVVLRLFADLQIVAAARKDDEPAKRKLVNRFERKAWSFLAIYLATCEIPDVPSFNKLTVEAESRRRSVRRRKTTA